MGSTPEGNRLVDSGYKGVENTFIPHGGVQTAVRAAAFVKDIFRKIGRVHML